MNDGELITVVMLGPEPSPIAILWRGVVDNDFGRFAGPHMSDDFVRTPPTGFFGFNGTGRLCYVHEAHEGLVWVHGHVTERDEAGAALLAAWHTGAERIFPPWKPLVRQRSAAAP